MNSNIKMAFFDLRRDFDSLFNDPLFTFEDPLDDYLNMRRRALDILDSYYPNVVGRALEAPKEEKKGKEKGSNTAIEKSNDNAIQKSFLRSWAPRCDMEEKPTEVVIHAEIPGMNKDQVKIDYDEEHNVISISGEKKVEREEDKDTEHGKYHYMERSNGSFIRSFHLPSECKTKMDECKAVAKDGVLEIHCPKDAAAAASKTRSITIS